MLAKKGDTLPNVIAYTILLISCSILVVPICLIIRRSLERGGLENYRLVFERVNIFNNLMNSFYVVGLTLLFTVVVCSLAAFAFSKLNFRGKNALFIVLMMAMMIPGSATLFPLFQITKGIGLINNPLALVGPYVSGNSIFGLMMLKFYYDDLPNEIVEAGRIDGASSFKIFGKLLFPMSLPGLSILLINTFNGAWNELMTCITLISDQSKYTMAAIPLKFKQSILGVGLITTHWNQIFACMVLCLIPILIFYLFVQRLIIGQMTAGAVKG